MAIGVLDKVRTPDGLGTVTEFERFGTEKGNATHAKVRLENGFARYYPLNKIREL